MQIGTITLTRTRVYMHTGSDVVVEPGTFPVFEEDGMVYWTMQGQANGGGPLVQNMGDGLILATLAPDKPVGPTFPFESKRMTRADFDSMNEEDQTNGALIFNPQAD